MFQIEMSGLTKAIIMKVCKLKVDDINGNKHVTRVYILSF